MLIRRVLFALALLLAVTPSGSARLFQFAGGASSAGPPPQTISVVPLSNTTFPPGSASGTVVGTIGTPIMSPTSPVFSGSCCTLSGTDAASFQKVGSNLETNGVLCGSPPVTYHINLVATQAGISNSPFSQAETITCSNNVGSLSFVNNGSTSTPGSVFPKHFLKTFKMGDVPVGQIAVPTVGGSPIAYSVDCASDGVNPLRSDGCASWPDGSLRAAPMAVLLPQLTAGATEQVVFATQAGSYSTSSTIRPSSITAVSDYHVDLTGASNCWVPAHYGYWPNNVQIGCTVSGGSVTAVNLRIIPPTIASLGGLSCASSPATQAVGTITAKIDNGSGSPGNVLTVSSGSTYITGNWLQPGIIKDNTSAIAANTVIIAQIGGTPFGAGTYTVSGSPQLVASEAMGFVGCSGLINAGVNGTGFTTPAIFSTTLGSNGAPTSVTLVTGGSGYSAIGSGALKFDVNATLNLYGSTDPPTCAAEQGAGIFSSVTYSGGSVTVNTVTSGHIATGQVIKDSTGATAIVTGTSSPWAVSAALTSGAMTANTPACVYADSSYSGQPFHKGYWVFGPYLDPGNSNAPDPGLMGSAQVDAWYSGGSLLSVRAIVRSGHEVWTPGSWWQSYTYNADIYNGTALVRGSTAGPGVYSDITDEVPGDWWTADPALAGPVGASAKPDWLGVTPNAFSETNNLAINAVSMYLAAGSEINYFRSSGAMLPLVSSLTPTPAVMPATTSGGVWDYPSNFQATYMPFGPAFLDAANEFGSGGDHVYMTPNGLALSYWIDLTAKASDLGVGWQQQMRVGGLQLSSIVGGVSEADTGHALNLDPAFSNSAFTDPSRLNPGAPVLGVNQVATPFSGSMAIGGQISPHGGVYDTAHWPSSALLGPYLMDGEYYQLKQMDQMITQAAWSEGDSAYRQITFPASGGTHYYSVLWNVNEPRTAAWGFELPAEFTNFTPPEEPDALYYSRVLNTDNYHAYAAFYPFTGAGTTGIGSFTKPYDWTAAGTCSSMLPSHTAGNPWGTGDVDFMCAYEGMVMLLAQEWSGGPGNNADLDTVTTEIADNFIVKSTSQNSCAYNTVAYARPTGNSVTGQPGSGYDNTDIPAPGSPPTSMGNIHFTASNAFSAISGQPLISYIMNNRFPAYPLPDGSVAIPTQWNSNESLSAPVPPSPLAIATPYKWCDASGGVTGPFTGTISGTSLTTPSSPSLNVGQFINTNNEAVNTYYVSGGGPTTWTLNASAGSFVNFPITANGIYYTGTTSGSNLTATGITGPLGTGMYIAGAGITPNTYYITGGTAPSFTLSGTPAAVGPEPMTVAQAGTLNPYSIASCSAQSPITPATTTQFNAGFIRNEACFTPANSGDWGDLQVPGPGGYMTEFWAVVNWAAAVQGATSDTTAGISTVGGVITPTTNWATLPKWDACASYTC